MTISVILPVLDERDELPKTLKDLANVLPGAEVIVSDGGSRDGTPEWVRGQSAIRMVTSARGRGPQMNAGASAAHGDTLLFLHADCRLPSEAEAVMQAALADPSVVSGAFQVRFPADCPPALHLTAQLINGRSRFCREATGDQAIFVRRAAFEAVDGFPDWPLFEDFALVARLKRLGRFQILSQTVTLSARRWEAYGVGRTNALMCLLYVGYRLRIPPATLKRAFADARLDAEGVKNHAIAATPLSPEHEPSDSNPL